MPSSTTITTTTTFLKLTTIVSSTYAKPHHHKCFLRRPQTITTTAASTLSHLRPKSACNFPPPMCSRGWIITPCAPLGSPAHGIRKLGFRFQKNFMSSSSSQGGMGRVNSYSKDEKLMEESHDQNHRRQTTPERLQQSDEKLLTLPTILTIGRVAAVPLLVSTFYMNSWLGTTATTSIFIAAAITDWLDGYLARKMNLGTAFGAFLDPVADKLMVAATLVLLCTRPPEVAMFQQLPWLLTVPSIAIIGREITMSAVREWAASQGSKLSEAVAVNNLGKWKTATQMISLTILLATRDSSFTEAGLLVASGVSMLYVSAGLALWSLMVYMRKIWKVLLM